mmetsp:Transcript_63559/g.196818  ORF Transcript_63559/g.196818 Transcript_63559/m.196818 type:complete len:254 (+) Transcript_63559:254-1015(+)
MLSKARKKRHVRPPCAPALPPSRSEGRRPLGGSGARRPREKGAELHLVQLAVAVQVRSPPQTAHVLVPDARYELLAELRELQRSDGAGPVRVEAGKGVLGRARQGTPQAGQDLAQHDVPGLALEGLFCSSAARVGFAAAGSGRARARVRLRRRHPREGLGDDEARHALARLPKPLRHLRRVRPTGVASTGIGVGLRLPTLVEPQRCGHDLQVGLGLEPLVGLRLQQCQLHACGCSALPVDSLAQTRLREHLVI